MDPILFEVLATLYRRYFRAGKDDVIVNWWTDSVLAVYANGDVTMVPDLEDPRSLDRLWAWARRRRTKEPKKAQKRGKDA
jgi:hypothetical protein